MKHIAQRTLALILALMMVLSVTTAFASGKTVAIDRKSFPDKAFRAYVSKNFDENKDGKLSASEIKKVTGIEYIEGSNIKSLKGIEHFTMLDTLTLGGTSVKTLDLRKNTRLKTLDIYSEHSLKTLKITGLKRLDWVDVNNKNLKSLDIAGCTKLLSSAKGSWKFEGDTVDWYDYAMFWTHKNTKLMNGKKLLREYAKPKSVKFRKSNITIKVDDEIKLQSLMKITPSTSFYPIKFSCAPTGIIEIYDDDMACCFVGKKPGTTTITAKCGGKTAKLKVTVE